MKLNIPERLTILEIVPKQGSFADLLFSKQISESVNISSEETDKYEIHSAQVENGVNITWNALAISEEKDCYLASEHIKLLKSIFEQMNENKKLNMSNFSTAAKIFDAAKELNI